MLENFVCKRHKVSAGERLHCHISPSSTSKSSEMSPATMRMSADVVEISSTKEERYSMLSSSSVCRSDTQYTLVTCRCHVTISRRVHLC